MFSTHEYKTLRDKRPNYNSPEILPAGAIVFVVTHNNTGKVYRYCYSRRKDAELTMENLKDTISKAPNPDKTLHYNFYDDPEYCDHIISLNYGKEE